MLLPLLDAVEGAGEARMGGLNLTESLAFEDEASCAMLNGEILVQYCRMPVEDGEQEVQGFGHVAPLLERMLSRGVV